MVLISSSLLFCTLLSPATDSTSPIVTKCLSQRCQLCIQETLIVGHCNHAINVVQLRKSHQTCFQSPHEAGRRYSQSNQHYLPSHQDHQGMEVAFVSFVPVSIELCINACEIYICNWSTVRCCALFRVPTPRPPVLQGYIHNFTSYMANFKLGWCKCALQNLERSQEDHLWSSLPGGNPSVFGALRPVSSMPPLKSCPWPVFQLQTHSHQNHKDTSAANHV